MEYKGYIHHGAVVLSEPVLLEDGTEVRIEVRVVEHQGAPTLTERLRTVVGKAEGMPADWSANHDTYLQQ